MYGTAMGAASGKELALETTPSQDGSGESGEKPQSTPLGISDDEHNCQNNPLEIGNETEEEEAEEGERDE